MSDEDFTLLVIGGDITSICNALMNALEGEVKLDTYKTNEYSIDVEEDTNRLAEFIISHNDVNGRKGISVEPVYHLGGFYYWLEKIWEIIADALPNDLLLEQIDEKPAFYRYRIDGVVSEEPVAA
ncbi:hypothetical protein [Lawsonella clevelandensis]|uniref:hypothetical protein n=1 Tax=Lawsonella clevelandensis TaxID=1528099 RepID=UPI0023F178FB|nr:hypothetical protein [Lawsonella clevelandensis]